MPAKSRTISMASGLALALLAGCHSYSPYGQPGYYGQPVYQPPAGSYIAPGGAVPGPALQVAPTGGAYLPNNPQAGNFGGAAPAFNPATDAGSVPGGAAGDQNLVPEYNDPGEFAPPTGGSFNGSPNFEGDAEFDSPSGANSPPKIDNGGFDDDAFEEMSFKQPRTAVPYDDSTSVRLEGIEAAAPQTEALAIEEFPTAATPAIEAGEFEQPIPMPPTSPARPSTPPRLEETSVRTPNPYAHDRQSFLWLRGTIDVDDRTGTWGVIYSLRPEADDEFGGSLELLVAKPALLEGLNPGDVVLVEGRVDRGSLDALGKPRYRVEAIAPLVPSH